MFHKVIRHFHPRYQPWATRQSYVHELVNALTFPAALAMVEGGVLGVLAKKAFDVSDMLFATIMAAPLFANLTSFFWARLARSRAKIRFISILQISTLASVGAIALLPTRGFGPQLLTLLIIASRCLLTGIVTLRSIVWRQNYPRPLRAQITGRLVSLSSIFMAIAPIFGYIVLDAWDVRAFRLIYPLSMLFGVIGVVAYSRVRLRGEKELLRFESEPTSRPKPHGTPGSIYEYDPISSTQNIWQVLRRDGHFRQYMFWQFISGVAQMGSEVAIIYIIVNMTKDLRFAFVTSITLTTTLPLLVAVTTLHLWAKCLDRMHVVRFRVHQGWFAVGSNVCNWLATLMGSLWVLAVARILQGLGRSGGMLAWVLGHNDFADRRMAAVYMGIHVTLTGVRGAIAPFLVMALHSGWKPESISLFGSILPKFDGIGGNVFLVLAGICGLGMIGFAWLDRSISAKTRRSVSKI